MYREIQIRVSPQERQEYSNLVKHKTIDMTIKAHFQFVPCSDTP